MENVWAMEAKYGAALGGVRGIAGLKAAADGETIWLRVAVGSAGADNRLLSLPVLHSYLMDKDELLFPVGTKTPTARLKKLDWQPIKTFVPVSMPVSAMPGKIFLPMHVALARSNQPKEAVALLTTLDAWKAYAEAAADTRLRQLRFAVSGESQALIMGQPLPQLPGQMFWANGQILIPLGYGFDPPVIGQLIGQRGGRNQPFLLFAPDGSYQSIPLTAMQQAKRSAIRLTTIPHA